MEPPIAPRISEFFESNNAAELPIDWESIGKELDIFWDNMAVPKPVAGNDGGDVELLLWSIWDLVVWLVEAYAWTLDYCMITFCFKVGDLTLDDWASEFAAESI